MAFSPLTDFAWDATTADRDAWKFGIRPVDLVLGGLRSGMLHILFGYTHAGKTQLTLTGIYNNPDKLTVIFTPDEIEELVITKLVALASGVDMNEAWYVGKERQQEIINEHFPKLAVTNSHASKYEMADYLDQVEQHYGEEVKLVVFDYLELMPDAVDVPSQARALKQMAAVTKKPWLVIHQSKRIDDGKPLTMRDMMFGGEREAATITAVQAGPESENGNSMRVSILKNKTSVDRATGIQLDFNPQTGLVEAAAPDQTSMHAALAALSQKG